MVPEKIDGYRGKKAPEERTKDVGREKDDLHVASLSKCGAL